MGGTESDRGWGIVGSANEVFVVGTTSSYQWDAFPLREFDPFAPLDFYQEYNNGGESLPFDEWYDFDFAMDFESHWPGEWYTETPNYNYDSYIASFRKGFTPVGFEDNQPNNVAELRLTPLGTGDQWLIHCRQLALGA